MEQSSLSSASALSLHSCDFLFLIFYSLPASLHQSSNLSGTNDVNDVNQVKEKRLIGSFQGQGIPLEQIHELTVVNLSTSAGAGVRRYKRIWRSSPVDQPTEHVRCRRCTGLSWKRHSQRQRPCTDRARRRADLSFLEIPSSQPGSTPTWKILDQSCLEVSRWFG